MAVISSAPGPPGQPDITYTPDFAKYQERTAQRKSQEVLQTHLPNGLPERLIGPLVWDGDSVKSSYNWTLSLSEEQVEEVRQALRHFQSLSLSKAHISPETFPLPRVRSELRRLSDELHHGHGFFVLRGINPDEFSREENIVIYAGISSHIAPVRGRQDSKYEGRPADVVLSHIKDLSAGNDSGVIGSPAYTTDKQVFHTDTGDIVSLYALNVAASGGASKLASTWRVYNELAETRPDLIHTLTESWDVENFAKGDTKYTSRPLMFHQPKTHNTPERIVLQYARRYFVGFGALPRNPEIPAITEAQAEALDTLHFLGEKYCVSTDFRKGDMQYVNNLAVFHARDGFTDEGTKRRHLLRLWLRDPENAWETPQELAPRWSAVYDGITTEAQAFPLEPYVRSESNKSR